MANKIKRAIGLFSGGLDSWLAALVVQKQGFDVTLLHFSSPYYGYKDEGLKKLEEQAKKYGFNLVVHEPGLDYIEMLTNPRYGYGKAINPCIDCHAFMLRTSRGYMDELKASFVFTGEVMGQRPMSQHKNALRSVEKTSNLQGYLIRPLSAKLLNESIPEQEGVIDREQLYDISGRGRKRQIELAKEFNLTDYPAPAGGCKFTERHLKPRFNYIKSQNSNINWEDMRLLLIGRHFNINDDLHLIIARDNVEVEKLLDNYTHKGVQIRAKDYEGAIGLLLNRSDVQDNKNIEQAASIVARYTKAFKENLDKTKMLFFVGDDELFEREVAIASDDYIEKCRL